MFSHCLVINSPIFVTSNVTYMNNMFNNCTSLTSFDLSNFKTNKVSLMSCMFYTFHFLTSLNLSNFNIQNNTDISLMFNGINKLCK